MFKKTRFRILGMIMSVATIIIVSMLCVIYIANSQYSYERGISLLENYVDNNNFVNHLNDGLNPMPPGKKNDHNKMFRLSTFYSVFFDTDGNVDKVECDGGFFYSEQEIIDIANNILSSKKMQGVYNKMPYLVKKSDVGTIVALIDNTMEMDNSNRLFENSLLVGISSWFIVFILSWFFTKKIMNPLEQNDLKQKQFISDAGHELKTPISVISANSDILLQEIGENKWLSNIQYENERMGNLVKQLLDLVRAESVQHVKERVNLSQIILGGTLPFESVAFEKGFIIQTDIEDDIYINGIQNQLEQLVSILVDNAIEHGQKEVKVKLYSQKHQAILSVINEGLPIADDIKNRLFERFYRIDEARVDDNGHYGLGLAIAKAIVLSHNGRIELNCFNGLIEFKIILPKL